MWPTMFIFVFAPMQSWAVNLNDCTKIKDPEQNAMCMAQATVSIHHCDKIKMKQKILFNIVLNHTVLHQSLIIYPICIC